MSQGDETMVNSLFSCQRCGRSNSSLRVAVFPYVFSAVIRTFERAWTGIYCRRCRVIKMTKAKLISALLGWWGIRGGITRTLGVMREPAEGEVSAEFNAPYLRELGAFLLEGGSSSEARHAWEASLELQPDPALERLLDLLPTMGFPDRVIQTEAEDLQSEKARHEEQVAVKG